VYFDPGPGGQNSRAVQSVKGVKDFFDFENGLKPQG